MKYKVGGGERGKEKSICPKTVQESRNKSIKENGEFHCTCGNQKCNIIKLVFKFSRERLNYSIYGIELPGCPFRRNIK